MKILSPQRDVVEISLEIVKQLLVFKSKQDIPAMIIGLLELVREKYGEQEAIRAAEHQLENMADFIDIDKLAKLLYDQDKTYLFMHGQLPTDLDEAQSIKNYRGQAKALIDQLQENPHYDFGLHTQFLGLVNKSLREYIVKNTKVS